MCYTVSKWGDKFITIDYLQQCHLNYLHSAEGQRIAAQNYYRPRDANVTKEYPKEFPTLKLFTLAETFGDWTKVQKEHFASGGSFDQISQH